jgi:hypothetical protein
VCCAALDTTACVALVPFTGIPLGVGDDALLEWAKECLCPCLNPFDDQHLPNSILILDNAVIHHSHEFVEMIEKTGALMLYLSPYSPDFSAIEPTFHQVKAYLRRNRGLASQDLELALWRAMAVVTPVHMAGYFRNCGYPLPRAAEEEEAAAEEEEALIAALKPQYFQ